jgi:hypothetical protein
MSATRSGGSKWLISAVCTVTWLAAPVAATAQAPTGEGFLDRLAAAEARVRKLPPSAPGDKIPVELNIRVDANAVISDWRARDPSSQSGTARRSGVRINGTPSFALAGAREVLFACPAGAFLDVTAGEPAADGSIDYDAGRRDGCAPGQGLVLQGSRLFCAWYTPPPGVVGRGPAEIDISTAPPIVLLGECITRRAEVVPALAFPSGRRAAARRPCAGSGVTINGRATGHSADCGG